MFTIFRGFFSNLHILLLHKCRTRHQCQIIKAKICQKKDRSFCSCCWISCCVHFLSEDGRTGWRGVHGRLDDVLLWWQSNAVLPVSPPLLHSHPPSSPLVRRWFSWRPHGRREGSGLAPSVYVMGIGAKRHGSWRERKEDLCGVGG